MTLEGHKPNPAQGRKHSHDGNQVAQGHDLFPRFETDFLNTCDQGLKLVKAIGKKNGHIRISTLQSNLTEDILKKEPHARRNPNLKAGQYNGSVYLIAPAKLGFLRPVGQWNEEEIYCRGRHIRVTLNGKVIVDYTEEENPERKGQFAQRLVSSGTFALQGHDPGSEVHYKNIFVKPLP